MPLYQTRCQTCHDSGQVWRKIADRDSLPPCDVCGGILEREIVAPSIQADIAPYVSPTTGEVVTSRNRRREDLKKSGSIEWEPGIREQIQKRRTELMAADEKKIENTVDNVVRDLNASGRLGNV